MELSRLKKVFAGVSGAVMFVSQMGVAIAAYSDVPAGIWYEEAVESFLDAGYLDETQTRFRGGDLANRAEFVKLVVELNGGILSTPPATPSFNDVAPGAWYYGYFEEAGREGWVRGDGSCYGTTPCYARPAANINRAEAAAILVRAFGIEATGDAPQFVDNPEGLWYSDVIQTAADSCVLQGDGDTGRVRPADFMNRAEMVTMLFRVDQNLMYGEDCGEAPAEPAISDVMATSTTVVEVEFNTELDPAAAADESKYMVANGEEIGVESVTRINDDTVELELEEALVSDEEYTLTVTGMMTADGESFDDSATFTGYSQIPQGEGTLEVSLASNNPLGDTVPKGAVGVVMTSVDLTATEDDVVIENLTVLHEGFGETTDISGVYAVINGERVTRKRTLDSSTTTANIRFQTPLRIAQGDTVTLDIAADFETTAATASEHALTVELPSDLDSNAQEVTGNFPLRGNTFRLAAISAGTLSVDYRSVTPSQIEVGDAAATIGKFQLTANSTEDQTIYSITLQNDGSAGDGDFTNMKVRRTDGTVVSNVVPMTTGDFATFIFDPPFTVLEGDSINLEVVADIAGGAAKNIKLEFDESSDIFAVGSLYGYGVNGQLYGSQVVIDTDPAATTVTIDAGQFTINVDGPTRQTYTPDEDNAVLANIEFETGNEDVDVEELFIAIEGTSSTGTSIGSQQSDITAVLDGVEIRNPATGRTVSGVAVSGATYNKETASGSAQVYRFDDFLVRGDETYEVRVDFANTGLDSGDRFHIHVCGEATDELSGGALVTNTTGCTLGILGTSTAYQMKIKGASTNDRIGDFRPGGTITGNFHDVRTSGLTITGKPLATSDTAVRNSDDINLLRFEAQASEAKDVLLTSLIFTSASGSITNANNFALWVDSDGDGTVDTIAEDGASTQGGDVTFDEIEGGGWVIPKGQTVVFEVHADIAASITGDDLQIQFDTSASGYVEAEEADDGSALAVGSTITVTTATATNYLLRNSGDLFVSRSATPVRDRQLLGGALGESIFRLQFRAQFEDIDVTDLVFTQSGSSATNFQKDVARLELYKSGATTPFATATTGNCETGSPAGSMCARLDAQELVVPEGSDLEVLVRPRLNTDENGATSGNVVQVYVDNTASSTNTGAIRARGLQSSTDLARNDADSSQEGEVFIGVNTATTNARMVSSYNQVVLSKVTNITNASPDADGTAIATGNDRAIGQFRFAAAPHSNTKNGLNDWVLSGVIFNVNATNVLLGAGSQSVAATSDFALYNKADPTTKETCTASVATTSGSFTVTCTDLTVGTSPNTSIDAGTDAVFVLESDVTNPSISGSANSTLQVSLSSFTTRTSTTFTAATSHISWVDDDSGTDVQFKWLEYPETTVNSTSYRS